MEKQKQIINIEGTTKNYEKIYNRVIKEVNKKDTISDLSIFALVVVVFAILQIWAWQLDTFYVIKTLTFLFVIMGIAILIRNQYDSALKIKKEITDKETIKKIYREQRKNTAKRNSLIILGICALFLAIPVILGFLLHGFILGPPGACLFFYILLLVVFGILSLIEFSFYKSKISERHFEEIEAKVKNEVGN